MVALLVGVPAACHVSQAQGARLSHAACKELAEVVAQAAVARERGMRHRVFADALARGFDAAGAKEVTRRIVFREVRRAFASPLSPAELEFDVFTRCMTEPLGEERV